MRQTRSAFAGIRRSRATAPVSLLLFSLFSFSPFAAGTLDAAASERAGSFAVSVAPGVDGNPLRLASDGVSSGYGELRFATGLKARVHPRLLLFLSGDASGRFHESRASLADAQQASARSGLAFTVDGHGRSRVALLAGVRAGVERLTFVDRATGQVFEVPERSSAATPAMRPIPDRFDANVTGAFAALRWAASRRLSFSLEADRENRNHVKDYSDETYLHPLDSRVWTVSPSVRLQAAETVRLDVTLQWSDRLYEAMPALDASGSEVQGTQRRDRYRGVSVSVHLDPSRAWDVDLGLQGGGREDPHAGYYDSRQRGVFVAAARAISERNRVSLAVLRHDLDYATARVADDPNGVLRASETLRGVARFERSLRPSGAVLFVEGGSQRTDNRDPVYAYERKWLSTGFRFRQ